ncbi:MAG: hypothetical protein VYC39_05065 [Myxococcota bacterium]|nr:hypothetical protein [Myxococcota bacterium]
MKQRQRVQLLTLIGISSLSLHCGFSGSDTGGVTASLQYEGRQNQTIQQGLRVAAPPPEIDRLLISVLSVQGSTLAAVELTIDGTGQNQLLREGGSWQISEVPVGIDHILVAQAFFGIREADASQHGRLAFEGRRQNIRVESGKITDAGVLTLTRTQTARIPRLDYDAPEPIPGLSISSSPEGNGLLISGTPSRDSDFAGAIIAISSSTIARAGLLTRGSSIAVGRTLPGQTNILVRAIYHAPWDTPLEISGLTDETNYQVYAYAFDRDFSGQPLNFAEPVMREGTPRDTTPPGPVEDITVTASVAGRFQVVFRSSGEDGTIGQVAGYQIRVDLERARLRDTENFPRLTEITPPEPVMPGETTTITAKFEDLFVSATDDFSVGIRAFDAAGNLGPIAVTDYTLSATISPSILQINPAIGLAGQTITVTGTRFGISAGRIELRQDADVTPKTLTLPVEAWSDQQVTFSLPQEALSGVLSLIRQDGRGVINQYLAIVRELDTDLPQLLTPFGYRGVTVATGTQFSALFSARPVPGVLGSFEIDVEQVINGRLQGTRYETYLQTAALSAVGASADPASGQFVYVAATQGQSNLNAWLISSSTSSPNNVRRLNVASEPNIDSLSLNLLDTSGNTLPAVLATAANGQIKIFQSNDLRSSSFVEGPTVTSTPAIAKFVTLRRRQEGGAFQYLMTYREGGSLDGRLVIQTANGQGNGPIQFNRPNFTERPRIGEESRILDVPGLGFVIAYEEQQIGGRNDVRLLALSEYSSVGFAPFAESNLNRRLHDVGLVTRNGAPFIAVLFSTVTGGHRLHYAEIDPNDLVANGRGSYGAIDLGLWADPLGTIRPQGRLSCAEGLQSICTIVWAGYSSQDNAMFIRR